MPPAALISLNASSTPFLKLVPAIAAGPDSSTRFTTMTGAWLCAVDTSGAPSASAAPSSRPSSLIMVVPLTPTSRLAGEPLRRNRHQRREQHEQQQHRQLGDHE